MNSAIINDYWDEHINRMVNGILSEGYSYADILYKVQDSINNNTISKESNNECTYNTPPNAGCKHKHKHISKSLSSRFNGLTVFIPGVPNSDAIISPGYNDKVTDIFKLTTGEELLFDEYMDRFIEDTTDSGSSYRNPYKIKFEINPNLSVGSLKKNHWNNIKTADDILSYSRYSR